MNPLQRKLRFRKRLKHKKEMLEEEEDKDQLNAANRRNLYDYYDDYYHRYPPQDVDPRQDFTTPRSVSQYWDYWFKPEFHDSPDRPEVNEVHRLHRPWPRPRPRGRPLPYNRVTFRPVLTHSVTMMPDKKEEKSLQNVYNSYQIRLPDVEVAKEDQKSEEDRSLEVKEVQDTTIKATTRARPNIFVLPQPYPQRDFAEEKMDKLIDKIEGALETSSSQSGTLAKNQISRFDDYGHHHGSHKTTVVQKKPSLLPLTVLLPFLLGLGALVFTATCESTRVKVLLSQTCLPFQLPLLPPST